MGLNSPEVMCEQSCSEKQDRGLYCSIWTLLVGVSGLWQKIVVKHTQQFPHLLLKLIREIYDRSLFFFLFLLVFLLDFTHAYYGFGLYSFPYPFVPLLWSNFFSRVSLLLSYPFKKNDALSLIRTVCMHKGVAHLLDHGPLIIGYIIGKNKTNDSSSLEAIACQQLPS